MGQDCWPTYWDIRTSNILRNMANTTKREREARLDRIEQAVESASDAGEEWTVEHRDAAPSERPHGMAVDASEHSIAYDFWEAQRECLGLLEDGKHDIVALLGGYRSGKSVTGGRWILSEAIEHAGERFLAMGTTYSEAVEATYRVLFEQLPGDRTHIVTSSYNGPENSPLVADYNRSEHRLTLVNDSVIVLGSADKWNRYAGDEYAGVWLDEPSHYGDVLHDLLEMVSTRLTASAGPKCMFWSLTGNGYNAAWQVLEKREDADGTDLGHTVELICADVADNPYIAAEDKARLKRQFEGTGREEQALSGGFSAAQGLVYTDFSRNTHVIEHDEALDRVEAASEWRVYGYDAGWDDPRVVLEVGKTSYGQLVVLNEFHRSASHVEAARDWLLEKPRGRIYSEHVPSDIQKFKEAGLPATKANKNIDSGIDEVRHRLEEDESGRVGLFVSERCENLIQEFHGYKREQVGTQAATDHCLDSLRYLCIGVTAGSVVDREQSHRRKRPEHHGIRDFGPGSSEQSLSSGLDELEMELRTNN